MGTKPVWSSGRRSLVLTLGAVSGHAMGSAYTAYSHFKFIKSLEEPERFSAALDNVQRRIGEKDGRTGPAILKTPTSEPSVPVPDSEFQGPPSDGMPQHANPLAATLTFSTAFVATPPPSEAFQQPPNRATPQPQGQAQANLSSWDRIRLANSGKAQQSSWDAIRQKHEKESLQRRPSESSANRVPPSNMDFDRSAEQAKFDAMLERERNHKFNE